MSIQSSARPLQLTKSRWPDRRRQSQWLRCATVLFILAAAHVRAEEVVVTTGVTPALKPATTEDAPKAAAKLKAKKIPAEPKAETEKAAPSTKTASRGSSGSASEKSIVVLVNDEPITGYELTQRASMLGGGAVAQRAQENFKAMIKDPGVSDRLKAILDETIKANQGKSKEQIIAIFEQRKKDFALSMQRQALENAKSSALPAMKKQALEELIDEKLKLQEAKRLNIAVDETEVDRIVGGIAERNKMTLAQFTQQVGGSLEPIKSRIRSTLSWNDVIRRQYGAQIAITTKDVDKVVASAASSSQDDVELQLQHIVIAMPVKMDQAGVAQRVRDAENVRAKFKDCKAGAGIVSGIPGAKFEDVGKRRPSMFAEPTRTLLLNAKDGEMLPPSVGEGGVELWAVCGRTVIKAEDQKRTEVESELKQKEFELLGKRHLKDLRQDAHIEYR